MNTQPHFDGETYDHERDGERLWRQLDHVRSAMSDDHASYDNGIGFSGLDTRIGNDLAARPFLSPKQAALGRKILTRYKNTQLPPELVTRMGLEVKS